MVARRAARMRASGRRGDAISARFGFARAGSMVMITDAVDFERSGGGSGERVEALMTELFGFTAELAEARTREEVGRLAVDKVRSTLGAIAGALWTVGANGTHMELLATTAAEHTVARTHYQQIPLAGDTPIAIAARTNEPIFIASLDEYRERFPASAARVETVRSDTHDAFAIVPLRAGDTVLGSLCFTYAGPRVFDDTSKNFKMIVARHLALALARVQLYEQERQARQVAEDAARAEKQARADVETLYELIASLNRLDDIDAIYDYSLRSIIRISRSQRAAILLFDGEGVMRFRAHQGLSDTYRAAVEGHSPWKPGESFPAPISVDDTEMDPAWAPSRDVFRAEGIRALAFVPIIHQRTLIGKFMLYRNEARPFAPRDLQLTSTIAVHVAQGIERKQQERELARAYREEREAHILAEEATRAREEIISVVSHDLRNPLGAILMGAATLLNVEGVERNLRVRTTADRIHRQAERMARLIEDLVDFAGIQAGKLALEPQIHEPASILEITREIFGPIAEERGLRLQTEARADLPRIRCDSDRAVQVLSNLVSNAVKVTPKGGEIAIGVQPRDREIVFYVRDSGPGIAAEELPNLFERYWRGKQSSYRGAGLGLSIARGIVDAHGGRIWAESRVGAGSVFYFSLAPSN
jgi:signal transduction histidine kinase